MATGNALTVRRAFGHDFRVRGQFFLQALRHIGVHEALDPAPKVASSLTPLEETS